MPSFSISQVSLHQFATARRWFVSVPVLGAALIGAGQAVSLAVDSASELLTQGKEAVAKDDYDEASDILRRALVAARAAKDQELLADVQELQKRLRVLEREFKSLKNARQTLDQSPDDPAANTKVGSFYCFYKADWNHGATLLARGEPGSLRAAAEVDIAMPEGVNEQVAAGDAWIKVAGESRDGQEKEQLHLRARHWYLAALDQVEEESQQQLIHARLDKTEFFPTKIIIFNTTNGIGNDRGTRQLNLVLMSDGKPVFQRRFAPNWAKNTSAPTTIRLPSRTKVDEVRVEVLAWIDNGGGLAELEVYHGDRNYARGAAASGDSSPNSMFRPGRLTDGDYGNNVDQSGLWLLSNEVPGSAVVHLNRRDRVGF